MKISFAANKAELLIFFLMLLALLNEKELILYILVLTLLNKN